MAKISDTSFYDNIELAMKDHKCAVGVFIDPNMDNFNHGLEYLVLGGRTA